MKTSLIFLFAWGGLISLAVGRIYRSDGVIPAGAAARPATRGVGFCAPGSSMSPPSSAGSRSGRGSSVIRGPCPWSGCSSRSCFPSGRAGLSCLVGYGVSSPSGDPGPLRGDKSGMGSDGRIGTSWGIFGHPSRLAENGRRATSVEKSESGLKGICFRGSALEKGAWVMSRWGRFRKVGQRSFVIVASPLKRRRHPRRRGVGVVCDALLWCADLKMSNEWLTGKIYLNMNPTEPPQT